ncbi:UDP-glucose 4-epimerase GalE [Spirochaeta lutea]|uniref:UDP-glucose 4-epimerase n=1 Tax=Spirochaeta lutea TaxID=1480694 RepID=A0A098R3Y5_9SPIO|nr:UDP-glucose 4-epimerase GalE [Spirochaeta lutea]KGE73447.1 UDP-glucose 4-epimerase [Spirochaeta lutea]
MKVLIIGGAGYIGSHVRLAMTEAGHQVHIFDNLSSGLRENLTPDTGFTHGDILHYQNLVQTMREQGPFDAVIHLAALKAAGESMIKPEKYSVANITGTLNILNAMCETGISRIVFSSSAATFGEPQYLPLDEDHPANPENYYGFTKLEIERFLAWYDKLKGIKFAALRYFNAAGYDSQGRISGLERNPANLLPVIMEVAAGLRKELQIFGNDYDTPDGTGVRDYVHVTDLASGHVKALEYITNHQESLLVNLGSETGISVTEMLETARRITQRQIPAKTVPRRPGDPAKLYATSARAKSLLGWEAKHSSVEELVATTWQAYIKALSLD